MNFTELLLACAMKLHRFETRRDGSPNPATQQTQACRGSHGAATGEEDAARAAGAFAREVWYLGEKRGD